MKIFNFSVVKTLLKITNQSIYYLLKGRLGFLFEEANAIQSKHMILWYLPPRAANTAYRHYGRNRYPSSRLSGVTGARCGGGMGGTRPSAGSGGPLRCNLGRFREFASRWQRK